LDASALGGLYGLVLGFVFFALTIIGSPTLWALYWSVETLHLSWYTVVVWQRTRLRLETFAGALAATASAAFVPASLAGHVFPDLSARWMLLMLTGAVIMVSLHGLAWWLHRDVYHEWRRRMQGLSLVDMLCMRHVPDLIGRSADASSS
jgi:hypothetical protein